MQPAALPKVAVRSIESWAPEWRQLVWTYDFSLQLPSCPNVFMRNAEVVLPRKTLRSMLEGRADISQCSDVAQAMCVALFGGFFADVDVLYLGKAPELPEGAAVLLHTEPERGAGMAFARGSEVTSAIGSGGTAKRCNLNLGFGYGPAGHWYWRSCADAALEAWARRATSQRQHPLFHAHLFARAATAGLPGCVVTASHEARIAVSKGRLDPLVACPLPRWLRKWDPADDAGRMNCGYPVANGATIELRSSAIQLWEKKWPQQLVDQVVAWATALRDKRRGAAGRPVSLALEHQALVARYLAAPETIRALIDIVDDQAHAFACLATASSYSSARFVTTGPSIVARAFLAFALSFHSSDVRVTGFGQAGAMGQQDAQRCIARLLGEDPAGVFPLLRLFLSAGCPRVASIRHLPW